MPDRGRDLTGDVGLPTPQVINANGTRVHGSPRRAPRSTIPTAASPKPSRASRSRCGNAWNTPGCVPTRHLPSTEPAAMGALLQPDVRCGHLSAGGRQPLSARRPDRYWRLSPNSDSRYLITFLSGIYGKVVVTHADAGVPEHLRRRLRMPEAQVRFWSLCSGESSVMTLTPDGVASPSPRLSATAITQRCQQARRQAQQRPTPLRHRLRNWGVRGDDAGRPTFGFDHAKHARLPDV